MNSKLTKLEKIVVFLNLWRCWLAYLMIITSKILKETVFYDIDKWSFRSKKQKTYFKNMAYLLSFYKEYRSLLYYRLKVHSTIKALIFMLLFKRQETLYVYSPKIGKGLFIQHGFSTIIAAKEIGDDCWIKQQVTIGYKTARRVIFIFL